jgi:hypothetical protein
MMRISACSLLLLFGLVDVDVGFAQPIYLGEAKFETQDRSAMAALIDHCTQLASEEQSDIESSESRAQDTTERTDAEQGDATSSVPRGTEGETRDRPATLSIDIDGLASVSSEQAPAGEGANAAAPPGETSKAETEPDVSSITLQSCREAGLVY